jgi:hypothetical protein
MKSSLLPVVLMIAFVFGTCRAQQFPPLDAKAK